MNDMDWRGEHLIRCAPSEPVIEEEPAPKKPWAVTPPERIEAIRNLARLGHSIADTASQLGITYWSTASIAKKNRIKFADPRNGRYRERRKA